MCFIVFESSKLKQEGWNANGSFAVSRYVIVDVCHRFSSKAEQREAGTTVSMCRPVRTHHPLRSARQG